MKDEQDLEEIKKVLTIEYLPPPPPPPLHDGPQASLLPRRLHAAVGTKSTPAKKKAARAVIVQPPLEIHGSLDPKPEDAIRLALRHKRPLFEHCYEMELRKQATFSGFVVVSLSVSTSGEVSHTRVLEGNPRETAVGACIANRLRSLKLPGVAYDAELILPIRLDAKLPPNA